MLITFTWIKSFGLLVKDLWRSGTWHGEAQAAKIDEQCCLQQILRRHWKRPPRRVTSPEQGRDPMRQRPDVQRHHEGWGTLLRRHRGDESLGGGSQHGEGPLPGFLQFRTRIGWDAGLEHRGVVGWLALCEPKVGFPEPVKGCEGIWTAAVPGAFKRNRELIEATSCHIDQQFVAVAKMSVGRRRTHSCPAGGFRECEAGRSLLRDQFQRSADQGLFQIAMVIAART